MKYLKFLCLVLLNACTYEEMLPIAEELLEISVDEIKNYLEEKDGSKD